MNDEGNGNVFIVTDIAGFYRYSGQENAIEAWADHVTNPNAFSKPCYYTADKEQLRQQLIYEGARGLLPTEYPNVWKVKFNR